MRTLGSTILRFDRVASTNDAAKEMAASGAPEGTCVLAGEQTAGRGRLGRSWSSPSGEGLYLSVIVRPAIRAAQSTVLTLASAVAVGETLELDFQVPADIKWPNDVMASGRKICGILVESAIEGDLLQYAVLGIGVNVSQKSFPPDLSQPATSIFLELGHETALEEVLRRLLARTDSWYREATVDPRIVISRWEELSSYARDCKV